MVAEEQFTNADWALFRQKVPEWQEAYMSRLLEEYRTLIDSEAAPSERFWALNKRLREDRRGIGVQINMRRSMFWMNLRALLLEKIITPDDLSGFSEEVRGYARAVCFDQPI